MKKRFIDILLEIMTRRMVSFYKKEAYCFNISMVKQITYFTIIHKHTKIYLYSLNNSFNVNILKKQTTTYFTIIHKHKNINIVPTTDQLVKHLRIW